MEASGGTDPIFRLVGGATCPSDDVSTLDAKRNAYSLLLSKGLIRVFMPLPANLDYQTTTVNDPYGCTDLSANPAIISVYRRPLPSANLRFLTGIMSDGREPSLESQANDATLIHAQATNSPSDDQIAEIVKFETQLFDAQVRDKSAGELDAYGANGGPVFLSQQNFYIGINDVLGDEFTPDVFTLFDAWQNVATSDVTKRAAKPLRAARRFSTAGSSQLTMSIG